MKKLALALIASVGMMSSVALADIDYGLEVGIRSQSGDVDGAGFSTSSQMGFQFGATAHFPISGPWHVRTGMLYTQRPLVVETDATGDENKITMNYLDIPVALMYKFEEYAGVFAGISLGMNLDKSCDATGCSVRDVKSPLTPLLIGAAFKFAPNLGVSLYYENASGDAAEGLKDYRAVGANLMITFD
ncbi:porin family protein [Bdellovibrio sp. 22V]|uniref:porin family protein n=1 Tax=Bdellovibrio TaxID=958 RepID=UPI0025437931|nr:porin family protein [Bdellovibrio sp. 22V]WII72112.1 porin family protein [Bdellovibrio sp. 22V]